MRIFLTATVAASIFLVASASAQNAVTTPSTKPVAAPKAAAGSAPVGHRQPTPAEMGKEDSLAPSAEDKELDRKIRNICKGC